MQTLYADMDTFLSDVGKKYFRMEQISTLLSGEYYDQKELLSGQQKMIESATKAFVDGLGDPFTSYLDVEQFFWLTNRARGRRAD